MSIMPSAPMETHSQAGSGDGTTIRLWDAEQWYVLILMLNGTYLLGRKRRVQSLMETPWQVGVDDNYHPSLGCAIPAGTLCEPSQGITE